MSLSNFLIGFDAKKNNCSYITIYIGNDRKYQLFRCIIISIYEYFHHSYNKVSLWYLRFKIDNIKIHSF